MRRDSLIGWLSVVTASAAIGTGWIVTANATAPTTDAPIDQVPVESASSDAVELVDPIADLVRCTFTDDDDVKVMLPFANDVAEVTAVGTPTGTLAVFGSDIGTGIEAAVDNAREGIPEECAALRASILEDPPTAADFAPNG